MSPGSTTSNASVLVLVDVLVLVEVLVLDDVDELVDVLVVVAGFTSRANEYEGSLVDTFSSASRFSIIHSLPHAA